MEVKEGDHVRVAAIGTTKLADVIEVLSTKVRVRLVANKRAIWVATDRVLEVLTSPEQRETKRAKIRDRDAAARREIPPTLPPPAFDRLAPRFEPDGPRAVPKPRAPVRSDRYLDFVRAKPCCSCHAPAPSDPHHFGGRGMGQKTDDFRTVPLCRFCHTEWHTRGVLPKMDSKTSRAYMHGKQVDLLVEFLRCELEGS
jgi:hypothetical protein